MAVATGSGVRPQDLAAGVSVGALGSAFAGVLTRRPKFAAASGVVAVTADLSARWLSRRNPSPFPARFKFALVHPPGDLVKLRRELAPQPEERILEIGPGQGHQAIDIATALGPGGRLDVVDVQPEMVDAVEQRARGAGLTNIHGLAADACQRLPYENEVFDAAYMIGVLGELPDPDAALREVERVLRPGGRFVVGETLFLDPDFVSHRTVRRRAEAAGFEVRGRAGTPVGFLARFDARK